MDRALSALEEDCRASRKTAQFEALAAFLSRPPTDGEYAAVGERLGSSRQSVAVAVLRLRGRYVNLVRAEVAQTVESWTEVEPELRYLVKLLSR